MTQMVTRIPREVTRRNNKECSHATIFIILVLCKKIEIKLKKLVNRASQLEWFRHVVYLAVLAIAG